MLGEEVGASVIALYNDTLATGDNDRLAITNQALRELENDPEVIARRKRYESTTVEQLTEEIQKKLRAS